MKASKRLKNSPKNLLCDVCNEEMDIEYYDDGNVTYPVFSCKEHGIKNLWKEWWEKYSNFWKFDEKWDTKKDLPTCIVSYFIYKYEEKFGFSFKMDKSNPNIFCGKEYRNAKKIISNFGEDFKSIRNYLKWCFFKLKKNNLTSLGYFGNTNLINDYLISKNKHKRIIRSTKLPEDFSDWIKNNYSDILNKYELSTYNDLNCMVTIHHEDVQNIINEARNRELLPKVGIRNLEE